MKRRTDWKVFGRLFRKNQSGQTLVLAAVCMTVLVGVLGLSVDAGVLRYQKRQLQNAADAAALAGALEITACAGVANCSAMQTAARTALTENGISGSTLLTNCASAAGPQLTVTINNPPCALASDPDLGKAAFVETVVSKSVPTIFAKVLGINSVKVAARAETTLKPSPCVYLLSQHSAPPSLSITNQTLQATCPFYLGQSFTFAGSAASSGTPLFVGGSSGSSTGSVSPAPTFNYPAIPDPLSTVPAPAIGGCNGVNVNITGSANLYPGTYCGYVNVQTSASATVQLAPGTYVILGSLTVNGPTLTGSGVTLYSSQGNGYSYGTISIQNVNATLSAPTSGSLQGILFYTDRNLPAGQAGMSVANWNPNSKLDGIFYLPGQTLTSSNVTLQGNHYLGVVADSSTISNTVFSPSTDFSSLANGRPFKAGGASIVQ